MKAFARWVLVVVFLGSAYARLSPVSVNLVCPPFDPSTCLFSKPGPPECHNDSQCNGSLICCCSNCGWKCVDPVKVKAGRCPPLKAKCAMPYTDPECQNDFDCLNLQKCCTFCGNRCVDPDPEPAGSCPKDDGVKLSTLECPSVYCSRDSDCEAFEMCCVSGGEKKCVAPVKPGHCPPIKAKCRMPLPDPKCQGDYDCPKLQKCCNICGKSCWAAKTDK